MQSRISNLAEVVIVLLIVVSIAIFSCVYATKLHQTSLIAQESKRFSKTFISQLNDSLSVSSLIRDSRYPNVFCIRETKKNPQVIRLPKHTKRKI